MGQCQDVDIPRFVECLGSFQYLDATAQMAEMGSRPADPQRAPFPPFRARFGFPETCRSASASAKATVELICAKARAADARPIHRVTALPSRRTRPRSRPKRAQGILRSFACRHYVEARQFARPPRALCRLRVPRPPHVPAPVRSQAIQLCWSICAAFKSRPVSSGRFRA